MGNKMVHEKVEMVMNTYMDKDTPLILAVSGGVDSVVLLKVLSQLKFTNITVAHINHSFRKEAEEDASFVRELAKDLGYTYKEKIIDLRKIASETKDSLETTGRKIRYAFLEEVRIASKSSFILTAHHSDDLLESRMMHLLRGSGLRGLEGMKVYDAERHLLRPLLSLKKEELREFAVNNGLLWKEDSTNSDTVFLRNKLRHDLIPLCYEINSSVDSAMDRLSEQAKEIEKFLYDELLKRIKNLDEEEYVFQDIGDLPPVLLKEFIAFRIRKNDPSFALTTAHIENICKQISALPSGHSMFLTPEIKCTRNFEKISIYKNTTISPLKDRELNFDIFPEKFSFAAFQCSVSRVPTDLQVLEQSVINGIRVRFPKEGDRVLLIHGERTFHKPLKKYFIEQKIPVELRYRIPVIISQDTGEILALLGQRSLVSQSTAPSIYLTCEHEQQ